MLQTIEAVKTSAPALAGRRRDACRPMRILVCDDHPLVRGALVMAVEACIEDGVVEAARDFEEAWALADRGEGIDLCLVDLQMPGASPADGLRGLQSRACGAKIIVVTGSERDEDLLTALGLSVDGFLPKSADAGVFSAALNLVMAGGRYLPPRVAALLAAGALRAPEEAAFSPAAPSVEAPYGRLSGRQREVLMQMAEGKANKEIARDLGLSPATVKTHVAQVIAVMGAANRTEAASRARQLGLL